MAARIGLAIARHHRGKDHGNAKNKEVVMAKGAKIDEPKEVAPPPDDQALLAPAPYDGCHFPERVFLERILAALKGLQLDAAASRETDCIRMLASQCMERKRLTPEDSRAIQNSWRILQAYSAREAKSIAPLSKPISDLFFWTTAPKHVRRAFETQNFILAALYSYICYAKQIPQGQPELAYMWDDEIPRTNEVLEQSLRHQARLAAKLVTRLESCVHQDEASECMAQIAHEQNRIQEQCCVLLCLFNRSGCCEDACLRETENLLNAMIYCVQRVRTSLDGLSTGPGTSCCQTALAEGMSKDAGEVNQFFESRPAFVPGPKVLERIQRLQASCAQLGPAAAQASSFDRESFTAAHQALARVDKDVDDLLCSDVERLIDAPERAFIREKLQKISSRSFQFRCTLTNLAGARSEHRRKNKNTFEADPNTTIVVRHVNTRQEITRIVANQQGFAEHEVEPGDLYLYEALDEFGAVSETATL